MIPKAHFTNVTHFYVSRLLIILALFGLMVAPARAAVSFSVDNYSYAADSYRETIAKIGKTLKKTQAELQQELDSALAQGNNRNAAVVIEQMLALNPNDEANWQKLADLLLIAEPFNSQDGYDLP
jgi:alpha-2-macroglobulin